MTVLLWPIAAPVRRRYGAALTLDPRSTRAFRLSRIAAPGTGQRRWPARAWSIVLALSGLVVLWVAIAFKLTSFSLNY